MVKDNSTNTVSLPTARRPFAQRRDYKLENLTSFIYEAYVNQSMSQASM